LLTEVKYCTREMTYARVSRRILMCNTTVFQA